MPKQSLLPGTIVTSPFPPKPVEVIAVVLLCDAVNLVGKGLKTGRAHDPILTTGQSAQLTVSADREPFDGRHACSGSPSKPTATGEYDPPDSLPARR